MSPAINISKCLSVASALFAPWANVRMLPARASGDVVGDHFLAILSSSSRTISRMRCSFISGAAKPNCRGCGALVGAGAPTAPQLEQNAPGANVTVQKHGFMLRSPDTSSSSIDDTRQTIAQAPRGRTLSRFRYIRRANCHVSSRGRERALQPMRGGRRNCRRCCVDSGGRLAPICP